MHESTSVNGMLAGDDNLGGMASLRACLKVDVCWGLVPYNLENSPKGKEVKRDVFFISFLCVKTSSHKRAITW